MVGGTTLTRPIYLKYGGCSLSVLRQGPMLLRGFNGRRKHYWRAGERVGPAANCS
jgi:hypothetical protein